jgi:hypothetical protein
MKEQQIEKKIPIYVYPFWIEIETLPQRFRQSILVLIAMLILYFLNLDSIILKHIHLESIPKTDTDAFWEMYETHGFILYIATTILISKSGTNG